LSLPLSATLIFEAAFQLRWRELRKNLPVILTFATVGALLSAAAIAAALHYLARWSWISASVFGVLITATDPVAVIACSVRMSWTHSPVS